MTQSGLVRNGHGNRGAVGGQRGWQAEPTPSSGSSGLSQEHPASVALVALDCLWAGNKGHVLTGQGTYVFLSFFFGLIHSHLLGLFICCNRLFL